MKIKKLQLQNKINGARSRFNFEVSRAGLFVVEDFEKIAHDVLIGFKEKYIHNVYESRYLSIELRVLNLDGNNSNEYMELNKLLIKYIKEYVLNDYIVLIKTIDLTKDGYLKITLRGE